GGRLRGLIPGGAGDQADAEQHRRGDGCDTSDAGRAGKSHGAQAPWGIMVRPSLVDRIRVLLESEAQRLEDPGGDVRAAAQFDVVPGEDAARLQLLLGGTQ